MTSLSELHEYFETYAGCIATGDARGIAHLFALPCMMASDDKSTAFTDANTIEALFLQGFSFLRKHGVVGALPDVRSRKAITSRIIQCNLTWKYHDIQNTVLYSCDYIYTLHHFPKEGWKIESALSINEKERMNEWLESGN